MCFGGHPGLQDRVRPMLLPRATSPSLPLQAARTAVPALGNQFIGLLKDSSLASVITVTELLPTTRGLVSVTYQPVPLYLAVGLISFLLSHIAARLIRWLEGRTRPTLPDNAHGMKRPASRRG